MGQHPRVAMVFQACNQAWSANFDNSVAGCFGAIVAYNLLDPFHVPNQLSLLSAINVNVTLTRRERNVLTNANMCKSTPITANNILT